MRVVGLKNVTMNEPHFTGHFPNQPVMPGVLIIEAMAQTAGVLVLHRMENRESKLVFLATIEQAKFRKPVVPGDQLRIEVKFLKLKPSVAKMQCEATVDGVRVAEAEMVCTLIDKPACAVDADSSDCNRGSRGIHRRDAPKSVLTASSAPKCAIGERTRLMGHVFVEGPITIGEDNIFYPVLELSAWRRRI